jgi:hypothetical protein
MHSRGGEGKERQYSYRVLYKRKNKILDNTTQRRRTIYEVDANAGHITASFHFVYSIYGVFLLYKPVCIISFICIYHLTLDI